MIRDDARAIWQAGVDAARPDELIQQTLTDASLPLRDAIKNAKRILVVGAGKAGASMAFAVENALSDATDRLEGIVNIPAGSPFTTKHIKLHEARPLGSNHPTQEGVNGAEQMLRLLSDANEDDIALCLISGGGSALLPAPVEGVSLADKQDVTKLLHGCGATINEMNAVRKHLSRVKGGRLAQAFTGKALYSLIISDVIGDPLDVIASGPTAADTSTFADALEVLKKYDLMTSSPKAVVKYLQRGQQGQESETLKDLPSNVENFILGNNQQSLEAARTKAESLGYEVLNLGSFIEGETQEVAIALSGIFRSRIGKPICILSGGETTVTMGNSQGKGGRNQEFVLAAAQYLSKAHELHKQSWVVLSGGTDGEDGPTDAAGAIADERTALKAREQGLPMSDYLNDHNAYPFFDTLSDLLKTGLTWTNVMDIRVFLYR